MVNNHLDEIYFTLNSVYPLILIGLGTIFNSLSIYIFTRKEFFKTSTGFYFSFSAIVDTLTLYFGSFKFFIEGISRQNPENYSQSNCQFFQYIIYTLVYISAWNLVIIAFDRLFITLRMYACLRNRKIQIFVIFISTCLFFVANIPILVYSDLKIENNNTVCVNLFPLNLLILNTIDFLASVFAPFVLVITISIVIIYKVYKSKKKIFNKNHSFKIAKHYVIVLIARSFLFLLLNTPIIITTYFITNNHNDGLFNLFYVIGNILAYVNYSINFFVHFLMNKLFRERFSKILKQICKK
jgi:hypothetical protein